MEEWKRWQFGTLSRLMIDEACSFENGGLIILYIHHIIFSWSGWGRGCSVVLSSLTASNDFGANFTMRSRARKKIAVSNAHYFTLCVACKPCLYSSWILCPPMKVALRNLHRRLNTIPMFYSQSKSTQDLKQPKNANAWTSNLNFSLAILSIGNIILVIYAIMFHINGWDLCSLPAKCFYVWRFFVHKQSDK